MAGEIRAPLTASLIILGLILLFYGVSSLVTRVLDLSLSLHLPIEARAAGGVPIGAGAAIVLWLLKYRKPQSMIVSTYFTFAKMLNRGRINELQGRSEPLVIEGPQKIVRHPLYLGAVMVFLGWGLPTNSTSNLMASLAALLWYALVQIPFEEKELRALFGDQYVKYMPNTPMLVPFSKRSNHQT
jgi:protein-S-isoprenylcysteine O-methyltransferase Ste14